MIEEYQDIIHTTWTGTKKRRSMAMVDRAKIFLPFAALNGYEEAIEEQKRVTVEKVELSEDMMEALDEQFQKIKYHLENKEHPIATAIYIEKDKNSGEEGVYLKATGMVGKLDVNSGFIQIVNKKIDFNNIRSLQLEE